MSSRTFCNDSNVDSTTEKLNFQFYLNLINFNELSRVAIALHSAILEGIEYQKENKKKMEINMKDFKGHLAKFTSPILVQGQFELDNM